MADTKAVEDNIGLYYHTGHGVNKAEALRQDFIFKKALLEANHNGLRDELEEMYDIVEELADIAGATVLGAATDK